MERINNDAQRDFGVLMLENEALNMQVKWAIRKSNVYVVHFQHQRKTGTASIHSSSLIIPEKAVVSGFLDTKYLFSLR